MFDFKTLSRLSVLSLYAMTMLNAGLSKLMGGGTPSWFTKQFAGTFLNAFDGALGIQFFGIAVVETVLGLLALLGALTVFKTRLSLKFMNLSLVGSSFLFTGLSFGQRITYKFQDSAILFFYSLASIVILLALDHVSNKESKESEA